MAILIYVTQNCPYCEQAKMLLERKKANYKVIDVTNDVKQRKELIKKSNGLKTVPQIFIDGKHIGGFDTLHKLDMQGKLETLIKKPHR